MRLAFIATKKVRKMLVSQEMTSEKSGNLEMEIELQVWGMKIPMFTSSICT